MTASTTRRLMLAAAAASALPAWAQTPGEKTIRFVLRGEAEVLMGKNVSRRRVWGRRDASTRARGEPRPAPPPTHHSPPSVRHFLLLARADDHPQVPEGLPEEERGPPHRRHPGADRRQRRRTQLFFHRKGRNQIGPTIDHAGDGLNFAGGDEIATRID